MNKQMLFIFQEQKHLNPNAKKYITTDTGFTLIEVVMALMVSMLMITTMYSCLEQIMRVKVFLDDERESGSIANSILDRLTREFQLITDVDRIMPPKGKTSKPYDETVDLIGKKDSITFIANDGGQYIHNGTTHTGLVQLTYRVVQNEESNHSIQKTSSLIRDEVPCLGKNNYDQAYANMMTFPVTSRLIDLKFSYYDQKKKKWLNQWDKKKNKLPNLIRFTIKLLAPSGDLQSYSVTVPVRGDNLE